MKVSKIALGVALALGGSAVVATSPVAAQQAAPRQFTLSKEERAAIAPLQTAVNAKDFAAAAAALPAAQAAAQGADARYIVATLQLQLGLGTNNTQMQAAAIDAMIASGGVPQSDLAILYKNQGALAQQANNLQKTEAAWTKWVELAPNDTNAIVGLAETKASLRKPAEAVALLDRAIDARKAAGQPVPDSWYKRALKFAYEGKMVPQSVKLGQGLVQAYPTTENWRDSLLIYRELSNPDPSVRLDVLRFMRASGALAGERDWFMLADSLYRSANFGEAKAVIDEGVSKRMIDLKNPAFAELSRQTNAKLAGDKASLAGEEKNARAAANGALAVKIADAWVGYGNYPKAIELYRLALQKGGVDAGVVNTRLGAALAAAGQRAEAETAFKSVSGPSSQLAGYWLIWLNQRG